MTRQELRTLITFDVSDPRIRYRVVKTLLAHAQRVQKSVFECPELAPAAYLRLRSKLEGKIDPDTDSLRYYRLCAGCVGRIEHFGAGPGLLDVPEDFTIIEP
jgi:CRISPR-associated protein Cas2